MRCAISRGSPRGRASSSCPSRRAETWRWPSRCRSRRRRAPDSPGRSCSGATDLGRSGRAPSPPRKTSRSGRRPARYLRIARSVLLVVRLPGPTPHGTGPESRAHDASRTAALESAVNVTACRSESGRRSLTRSPREPLPAWCGYVKSTAVQKGRALERIRRCRCWRGLRRRRPGRSYRAPTNATGHAAASRSRGRRSLGTDRRLPRVTRFSVPASAADDDGDTLAPLKIIQVETAQVGGNAGSADFNAVDRQARLRRIVSVDREQPVWNQNSPSAPSASESDPPLRRSSGPPALRSVVEMRIVDRALTLPICWGVSTAVSSTSITVCRLSVRSNDGAEAVR